MFVSNPSQQISLHDPVVKLPKYLLNILFNSWAHIFQNQVFPIINEKRFSVLYSNNEASRPNTPVNVIIGLLILKEIFQLSDEELIGSLHFDIRFQYALRTTSFEKQPVSINTLSNFRRRLAVYLEDTGIDLIQQEIEAQAKLIGEELKIDGKSYRMDSLMISASCKKLNRISLIFNSNLKGIKLLSKKHASLLPVELKQYLETDFKQEILYRANYENVEDKMIELLKHSVVIKEIYERINLESLLTSEAFEVINRLVSENLVSENSDKLELVPSKDLLPTSLQSHTDPDATYRTKYGPNIGYVANVAEHFDDDNCLIEYYDFQKNIYSDIKFSEDTIEKIHLDNDDINEDNPANLIIDGTYYGYDLSKEALKKGVKLYPTDLVGRKQDTDKISFIEFEIDKEKDCIVRCPNGRKPVVSKLKKNKKPIYYAKFDKTDCESCEYKERCPYVDQEKYNCIKVYKKQYHAEKLRKKMKTDDYFEIVRHRAAIEGIPSVLRRRYHVDNMPVRRLVRSKIWFGFKIAAINVKRLIKSKTIIIE